MKDSYDIIIIGGGATGSGIALDASLRGYSTLVIDKDDFSSKTSSNSTKLVHGGVRYLEKAVLQVNKRQFKLVKEALEERYYFLQNASNMTKSLRLHSFSNTWFQTMYYYIGLKLYDWLSFDKSLGKSQCLSHKITQHFFPTIQTFFQNSISFFDGVFNDMKVNIALLKSAQDLGCDVYNYHEVTQFLYDENHSIKGIRLHDKLTEELHVIRGKVIINATGYFCDHLRKLDQPMCDNIIEYSKGSHILLDGQEFPCKEGLLIQHTRDNRVLFMLPYENNTLVGTTEVVTTLEENPIINEDEINFLLEHINEYFTQKVTKAHIIGHFSGIRPLIKEDIAQKSSNIVREHCILQSASNLITIAGGKWTTYRKMAQECLDFVIEHELIKSKKPCSTKEYKLYGNESTMKLEQLNHIKLDRDIKEHLLYTYGNNTIKLLEEFDNDRFYERLIPEYPYILAELYYSIKYEYVHFPNDFLFRRIALGKINLKMTQKILSRVVNIMSEELQWENEQTIKIYQEALKEINELLYAV